MKTGQVFNYYVIFKTMKRKAGFFLIAVLGFLVYSCSRDSIAPYIYMVPEAGSEGWEVAYADSEGVDHTLLEEMMDLIRATPRNNIHCILVFKNGKLVFEEYFEGYLYSSDPPGSNGDYIMYDSNTDHYLASVSKTVTSAIFGVAVKMGYITDLDERLVEIFPEYAYLLTGGKEVITVRHLLTMTAGLAWDESSYPYGDPRNDVSALFDSDPIASILDNTFLSVPGTKFLYNSGATNILGAIIEVKTGMDLLDFANEYFFDPLEVSGGLWQRMGGGLMFASGGVFLRPRELAKIGHIYINGGYWGDRQLVTTDWIDASVSRHIATSGKTLPWATHYGYQWWLKDCYYEGSTFPCFLAAGWGGQYMFVFPDHQLVVVTNAGNYLRSGSLNEFELVEDYILSALY